MGKDNQDHLTIQELLPNSKIVFAADGTAGNFVHEIEIIDQGNNQCQVSKSVDAVKMNFPLKVLKPLFPMLGGRGLMVDLKKNMETVHSGGDEYHAWGIATWTSTGFHENGTSFHRPGRATVILERRNHHWVSVHTHFSLNPGTSPRTYGPK